DHYGLEKIKERIVEYLAVRKLNPTGKAPILCFVGPPGVGKTSLGKSIARAMGRAFARVSLGGVHDEAEIRGHRRTYIGALAGYTLTEKLEIAMRYLVPRQLEENGVTAEQVKIARAAVQRIIRDYTREAGVRNLEREIGSVIRRAAVKIAEGSATQVSVDEA